MKILVDTNVLVDFFQAREPYAANAARVLTLCAAKRVEGYIAAHTVPNLFYVLRKSHPISVRRNLLLDVCRIFTVSDIDMEKLVSAIKNEPFSDFEDCLQAECAKAEEVDYIVTRNLSDFRYSVIPALSPDSFLSLLNI